MFCIKCGTEIPEDAQFCFKCGSETVINNKSDKIISAGSVNLVAVFCTNCHASLEVDVSKETAICPYCGTTYIVSQVVRDSYPSPKNSTVHKTVTQVEKSVGNRYLKKEKSQKKTLSSDERAALEEYIRENFRGKGRKAEIAAVKYYREQTLCGLKEANDAVELILK